MKNIVKYFLHRMLGFQQYLFVFSLFKIDTLRWDKKEKDFFYFLDMIGHGGIVLDIGANIGVMTVHLSKRLKDSTVFSFEPVPHNARTLKRIIAFYYLENVKVFECALGNKNGLVTMVTPVENSVKMHGLSHVAEVNEKVSSDSLKFTIPIRRLDDIEEIRDTEKPVTGIKLDVENYEFNVLEGARNIIEKHKPVIYCELWENETRPKTILFLKGLGYRPHIVEDGHFYEFDETKHHTQNFFFCTAEHEKKIGR